MDEKIKDIKYINANNRIFLIEYPWKLRIAEALKNMNIESRFNFNL